MTERIVLGNLVDELSFYAGDDSGIVRIQKEMHPEWSDEDISRAEKRCLMAKPYTDDEIALKVTENALVESLRRRGVRL